MRIGAAAAAAAVHRVDTALLRPAAAAAGAAAVGFRRKLAQDDGIPGLLSLPVVRIWLADVAAAEAATEHSVLLWDVVLGDKDMFIL